MNQGLADIPKVFDIVEVVSGLGNIEQGDFETTDDLIFNTLSSSGWELDANAAQYFYYFHALRFLSSESARNYPNHLWMGDYNHELHEAYRADLEALADTDREELRGAALYRNVHDQDALMLLRHHYDDPKELGGYIDLEICYPASYQDVVIKFLQNSMLLERWPHAFSRHLKMQYSTETNFIHAANNYGVSRAGINTAFSVFNMTEPATLGEIEIAAGDTYVSYSCNYRNWA